MNTKLLFIFSTLFIWVPGNANTTKTDDLLISIKKLNTPEKRQFFSCLNPIKSRHLTTKYTLFELTIKNKSNEEYILNGQNTGLTLMSPERISQRVSINRSWIPIALTTACAVMLSSVFYIAYVPCIAISITLGASAVTFNPNTISHNNQIKMLSSVFDTQHELIIPSCSTIQKFITVRTRKNRGKTATLFLKKNNSNATLEKPLEIKIPCI